MKSGLCAFSHSVAGFCDVTRYNLLFPGFTSPFDQIYFGHKILTCEGVLQVFVFLSVFSFQERIVHRIHKISFRSSAHNH